MKCNCPDCEKPCSECERIINNVIPVGTWIKPKTELYVEYYPVGYDPCKNCPNNSANGGSGICCCSLPNFNKRY